MAASSTPHPSLPEIPNLDYVADGVYIGGARATFHLDALRETEITAVLKLYFHDPYWPQTFTVCELALNDGECIPGVRLEQGVTFIRTQVQAGQPVLVACWEGRSHSSTFVLAYLLSRGDDLRQAWDLLKMQHAQARPAPQLWASLLAFYDTPYQLEEVLKWAGWHDKP